MKKLFVAILIIVIVIIIIYLMTKMVNFNNPSANTPAISSGAYGGKGSEIANVNIPVPYGQINPFSTVGFKWTNPFAMTTLMPWFPSNPIGSWYDNNIKKYLPF